MLVCTPKIYGLSGEVCADFALARVGDRNAMLKRPKPELFFTCHHNSESYGASGGTAKNLF